MTCVCARTLVGVGAAHPPGPLRGVEVFLRYLLPLPSPPVPSPPVHLSTQAIPHQEQGLFVGLICPATLEGFSINKPFFMGW